MNLPVPTTVVEVLWGAVVLAGTVILYLFKMMFRCYREKELDRERIAVEKEKEAEDKLAVHTRLAELKGKLSALKQEAENNGERNG